jgi:hypothetical protein
MCSELVLTFNRLVPELPEGEVEGFWRDPRGALDTYPPHPEYAMTAAHSRRENRRVFELIAKIPPDCLALGHL